MSSSNKTLSDSGSSQRPLLGLEDSQEEEFHTLSAEEAQAWRQSQPKLSVWWVLVVQLLAALVLAAAVFLWFGRWSLFVSLIYGALSVVLPAALFARGLKSPAASVNAFTATLSFAVWQGVKMALTVLLMVLAPRVIEDLSWPDLLAGLIVTMKVYWLALIWGKPPAKSNLSTPL
jgi:ATP synthase protein I